MLTDAIVVPKQFHDLLDEWETSNDHYFLTGKAGTGKSTLLQLFRNTTKKTVAVLAPTGMAAIQIKGQTIHSFFRFPPRLLTMDQVDRPKNFRLIQKLDTIVVDEVSMVRADMMDAMDRALRLARRNELPFGGLQMIFIGDIFQLPPILSVREEKLWFESHYSSPYFFDAHCLDKLRVHLIELEKVYRQNDPHFIHLLDSIRTGEADDQILADLNQCVGRQFRPDELFVTLCSLNFQADAINRKRMELLEGESRVYLAQVVGEVSARQVPAEPALHLKPGAQVMFIKNDPEHRYVNGTLGKVVDFSKDGVWVLPENARDEKALIEVVPSVWEMIRYRFNREQDPQVSFDITGTFKQLPIKPAWAITIHKSQGQSYDRVMIDMGRGAFEYGQTYVALSRCRTLEGISLVRPLTYKDLLTDPRILDFFESKKWA